MKEKVKIYNSLTRKKETFSPIVKNYVGMYVCGPTVYGEPHLGHARPAITFDIIYRYFKHLNYKVRYVRNITDAGHLENDSDDGEDKIAKKALIEKLEPMEVVQTYTLKYHKAMEKLNCLPPSIEPRATGHIIEQIEMVKKIIANGFAYVKNGSVYLDVKKYDEKYPYGILSGRNLKDTLEGTRDLESQSDKKNPVDFAIWKKAEKNHIMKWTSPWGEGFPGWHMECSAMSEKYLGKKFDIHGGGMDLLFPHHEAEIAQSNASNNCNPVNFWVHNNMVTIEGRKMGKSLNNFINLEEFFTGSHKKLKKEFSPMTIRFFMLQAHYRSTLDFSNEALQASEKGLEKLMASVETLKGLNSTNDAPVNNDIVKIEIDCYNAMNDDFNTPILISHLFECVKLINSIKNNTSCISDKDLRKLKSIYNTFVVNILGLEKEGVVDKNSNEELMNFIVDLRDSLKKKKQWEISDSIRDNLLQIGIEIQDTKDGTKWKKK